MTDASLSPELMELGREVPLGGNRRLLLDDPDVLWILTEGRVEVFMVGAAEGRAVGARRHLVTLKPGDGAPGLLSHASDGDGTMTLLAVATEESRLLAYSVPRLLGEGQPAVDAMDRVLLPVLTSIAEIDPRQIGQVVEDTGRQPVEGGRKLGSRGGVVWAFLEGQAEMEGVRLSFEGAPRPVPLAGGAWLEVDEAGEMEFLDTEQVVESGHLPRAWKSFLEFLADFVWLHARAQSKRELDQLEARVKEDRRVRSRALRDLLSIVVPGIEESVPVAREDRLLAACRIVGEASGVTIKDPPTWVTEGGSTDPLGAILSASRIRFRKVALRGRWWTEDAGPILAFRGEDRSPVALLPEGGHYEMVDPASGERARVDEEIRDSLHPFGHTFYRTLPDRSLGLKDLFAFAFQGMGWSFGSVLLLAAMSGILGLFIPVATGFVFNTVIPSARPNQLLELFIGLSVTVAAAVAFELTRGFVILRLESRGGAAMQAAIFDRLLKLPARFFRSYSVGDLVTRVAGIGQVQTMLSTTAVTAILGGLAGSFNLALLFYYDWRLALFALGWVVLAIFFIGIFGWLTVQAQTEVQEMQGRLSGLVLQLIGGIAKLRLAGAEDRALAQWGEQYTPKVRLERKAATYQAWVLVFNDLLPLLTSLVLFGGVGILVSRGYGVINTAAFIAFNAALGTFLAATVSTSNTLINLATAVPLMRRATPILAESPEVELEKPDPGELSGQVEGLHLDFRYVEGGPLVLQDVSFRADPGEFVAFVGPSGSGKSTTLRLLLGFERPESGGVYYDGKHLDSVDVSAVRRQMGVVLQSSRLMSGDIFTNIVGSAPLTQDDAWEAAEMAGLADDIREMPMGLNTMVSEGGSTLSGGQRQRLLIARALARRPRIILFDEATSALDNRTQAIVSESLEKMHATRIVIAHRLSTIRKAHRIYVMVKGVVKEVGDYDTLMARDGIFARLAARQLT